MLSSYSSHEMGFHANIRLVCSNSPHFRANAALFDRTIVFRIWNTIFFCCCHLPELKTMFAVYDCSFFSLYLLFNKFRFLFSVFYTSIFIRRLSILFGTLSHHSIGTFFFFLFISSIWNFNDSTFLHLSSYHPNKTFLTVRNFKRQRKTKREKEKENKKHT